MPDIGGTLFGATALVVASDADPVILRAAQEMATFGQTVLVCDGTADEVQINAAIANLPSTGGKILLTDGTFTCAGSILATKPFVLEGQGISAGVNRNYTANGITTITLANSVNDSVFKKSPLNDTTANTHWHVEIKNLCVNGNGANQTSGHGIVCDFLDVWCENVRVRNCKQNGFNADQDYTKNQVNLNGCEAIDNLGSGAYLLAQGCWIGGVANVFSGNTLDGLYVGGATGDGWIEAQVEANGRYGFRADQIGTSYLNIMAMSNQEMGAYLDNVYGCYGIVYARANSITGAVQTCDIGLYNVRECNFQLTAKPYAINRRGITFGDTQRKNTYVVNVAPNEGLSPITGVVGLHFANWGTLNLAETIISGSVRAATAYQFDGVASPAGLDLDKFFRHTILIDDATPAIGAGETRLASGALAAGLANAYAFNWQNPYSGKIAIKRVMIYLGTAGGTANSVLDVGVAAGTGTHDDTLIDGLNINQAGVFDNINDAGTNGKSRQVVDENGGTNDWVTGQILVANASSLVGRYEIEYVGV